MSHILSLIGAPGARSLDPALAAELAAALPGARAPQWLGPGEACDIPFTPHAGADLGAMADAVRAQLEGAPVDVNVLPAEGRAKALLVADMDSTIIQQECIDEIADFAGLKPAVAAITERAMRGELEFEAALRERVGLLKGLEAAVLQQVFDERLTFTPGAHTLIATMRAHGAYCVLVSGGFTFFTSRVAAHVGFDVEQANILEIAQGRLSGLVSEPILGRDAKLEALRRHRAELGLRLEDTIAVGDGANDLAMIQEAGLGVAFHAKPIVAEQAQARIEHGDLTALLYLQGYTREAFAG